MKLTDFTNEHYAMFNAWTYPEEYSVYNIPEWDAIASHGYGRTGIPRENHMAVLDSKGDLLGVCCFQNMSKYTYVGICLKPEECDKGYGEEVLNLCLDDYKARHPKQTLVAEIRKWNSRSLITFMKVGFKVEDIRSSIDNLGKPERFVLLVYKPNK